MPPQSIKKSVEAVAQVAQSRSIIEEAKPSPAAARLCSLTAAGRHL